MRKSDRSDSRRRQSEKRIILVKAEMVARHLYYSTGYLAARRRQFSATNENEDGQEAPKKDD